MAKERIEPRPPCPACGAQAGATCRRIDCANHKPITARVPDGSSHQGVSSGCSYRAPIRSQE